MRRLPAGGLVVAAAVLAGTAPAWAARIQGTQGSDRIVGTAAADQIFSRGGADRVQGRGGADLIHGGPGPDTLDGERGDDRLAAHYDDAADTVVCGRGRDVVNAEPRDRIATDCEVVSVQIARDGYATFRAQHETQVEPDSFAWRSTIVTTFQNGRFDEGGAANIGWATSRDGGRSWRSGVLPGLSLYSSPPGRYDAVSDPVVAFDALHGVWLIATLGIANDRTALLVSRSRDGLAWEPPVVVASDGAEDYDKEWIVCDNWPASPFRGRCYVSYLDFVSGEIRTRSSSDGGRTWSGPGAASGRTSSSVANGAQPAVRPDGTLVVVFAAFAAFARFDDPDASEIAAARSTDGGVTFGGRTRISRLAEELVFGMRAPALPSVEVDGAGTLYVAWHDCGLRPACAANDIVLARSTDGARWSGPVRVPTLPLASDDHAFVPGLGVDPSSAGRRARLAIAYYVKRQDCGLVRCPGIDVAMTTSADAGTSWTRPQRLNAESMPLEWLADTGIGRMVGDYISTSWVGGRPVPVFSLATQPVAGTFQQATFATTRLAPRSGR
jgi:hypothetical protein